MTESIRAPNQKPQPIPNTSREPSLGPRSQAPGTEKLGQGMRSCVKADDRHGEAPSERGEGRECRETYLAGAPSEKRRQDACGFAHPELGRQAECLRVLSILHQETSCLATWATWAASLTFGCGSKIKPPGDHIPGFNLGTGFLTRRHLTHWTFPGKPT